MRIASGLLVVAACGFPHGSLTKDDAPLGDDDAPKPMIDAAIDAPFDAAIDAAPNLGSCNTTALTCITGTPSALTCNGACWVKCQQATPIANQAQAKAVCAAWGGKLAPILSQLDNDCVAITLFPAQASWIGLEQDMTAMTKTAGWSNNGDGVALNFTNWDNGQPDDSDGTESGQEQCAYIPTSGKWHDTDCAGNGLFRFSCRR